MRKPVLLLIVLTCIIGSQYSNARILRVGYLGTPVAGVDFAGFDNNVIAAANNGDTIQIYQNNNLTTSTATITKKLVFIGFGYMLDKNPGLQATVQADNSVTMYFNPGSEESVVQGINIYGAYIAANNITITRCRVSSYLYLGYNPLNSQQPSISNINVFSNFIAGSWFYDYGSVSNLLVSNNIFYSINIQLDNSSGIFTNNVITSSSTNLNSFVVRNNIVNGSCPSSAGSVFQNNIFSSSSCSNITGNNNQFGVNMNNVFANWSGGSITADNQLQLKTGSPAVNAGINGAGSTTDAGVFGGDPGLTYRLSGIPAVPSIYQLSAPTQTATNNPYTITVSVRSNN